MKSALRKVVGLLLLSLMTAIGMITAQPTFTSTPITTATVGTQYTYGISATDPSNNTLNFSALSIPSWLTLNNNGQSSATQFGGTIASPGGIAGDVNGNTYVSSFNSTTLYKIDPNGVTTAWFSRQGGDVYGMYVYNNFLYISYYYNGVSGRSKITKVNLSNPSAGEVDVYVNPTNNYVYLSMTYRAGFLYVAAYGQGKVIKVDVNTNVASDFVTGISSPFGLGFNAAGILYIASYGTGSIYSFNPATSALTQVATGLQNPSDVKVDAYDNIYVSGYQFVRKYTPNLSSFITVYAASSYVWGMSITPTGALVFGDWAANRVAKLQTGASLTGTPPLSALGVNNVSIRVTNGTTTADQNFAITVYAAPTISAMPNISRAQNLGPITLTNPTSNSNGAITYTSSNPSVVSVSGNNLILNAQGTVTITANQAASGFYTAGSTTFTVTVTAPVSNPAGALNFVKTTNLSGNYITVPHSASLNLGAEFTIEAWVNYTGTNSTIIDKGDYNYLLQLNCSNAGFAPNRIDFYSRNNGQWAHSTGTVPEGVWTHVAVTLKNGTMTFYINGVASGSAPMLYSQDTGPVNIGRQSPTSCACNSFNGSMDELRIWNRALPSCEINANKSCELSGTQTLLAAYYKFNQGNINANNSGINTLADASGNSNTGTLNGFALTGTTSNWVAGQVSGTCAAYTAPTAAISGTLNACLGATSQLSNSITGGTWSSSNNGVATINGSGLVTAVAAGTTTITYTNSCGGVSTATFTVNALLAASISTSGSTTLCTGGSVTLSAVQTLPGNSLSFNGTNNAVRIPDVNYAGVNSFTIEAWVKPNNITTNPYYEIARQQGSPNWIFSFQDYGTILSFGLNTTTGYAELDAPITAASFTDGNWHHVAATYDGTNCRVYKDGVLIGTSNKTGNIVFSNSGLTTYIGAYAGGEYFNGLIDEVRFWNTTRTQAQLDANKLVSLPGNTTGLTAYYKFDEGTGTTTNDASGNNNHGTLINGTSWSAQTPIASGTGGTYLWSNGETTPSITVNTAGAYTVTVTSAAGCSQTSETTNVVVNTLPVASITAAGSTTFCAGGSVALTASGGATYLWNTGATSSTINVTSGGTYSVTATTAEGCVSAPASITLTQLPAPTVNPITDREVCHNAMPVTAIAFTGNISGTVYNWTNNNPSIGLAASGTGDIASFLGQNTGTVPVYATITVTPSYTTGDNTCTGTPISFTIRVNPIPVINPIANITVCNGTVTAPFTISSAVEGSVFRWIQPTNIPYVNVGLPNGDGANVPSFIATNTGTTPITATFYAVSYYSGETMGCGTSRQFDVTVNPTPAANITADGPTTFCTGGSVTLTASTGASYLWSNGAQTQSITVNQSGNYSVVVTSAAGCSNTSSPTVVTVNALPSVPVISTSGSTTVCVGNAVTLSAGAVGAGNAIDFDGSNDNIVIPNNAAFNFTSQYTAEAWINVRSYQYGTIIAKFEDDNNNRGWMVNMGETGDATKIHVVHSRLGSWTNPIQWNSGFQPALNTWYHIAVVFDASLSSNQIKLYVNGTLTSQTSWPYTITPNAANMYIGGYDGPGNGVNGGANSRFFNGRIDEVRVWNVARTAPQINANYNQLISTPVTGLVAAYSFNETAGNAILDVTGVNNGTMVNNPTRISNGPSIAGGSGANNTYLWSTGATSSSISVTQPGSYSVTVTNENGCSATSAPVAVSNYAMPTITCPANITVASPANQCGANVTYPNATVTAGPANPTVTYSHASGSFFPVGTTTVTATVTDACGNTASCTFTVTVQDVTAPVLACSNQSSSTPVNFMRGTSVGGTAAIVAWTGINGASQYAGSSLGSSCSESWRPFGTLCDETPNTNSLTTSTKSNPNSGITFNTGGASSTGVFVVDLGVTQTFNLAQVYQMFSDGKTTHVRGFYHPSTSATAPSITDAGWVEMFPETLVGPGAISGSNVTQPTEVTFNTTSARYVRFYVRNDGRYGSSTWIETRSIKLFNTAPAVNNIVVTAADGQCTAVATYNVQAIDNCSGTVVTYSIPSGSSFPIGTTPVQVTATDASGNTTTCSFSVIVNAPEINITGNGSSIATGTTATSAANNTHLGGTLPNTPVSKTFAIQNIGTASLTISSIDLSGTDASAFSVSGITLPATIAPNAAANFNVVFNSNVPGIKNATVTLNNNDCNEGTYQFAVSAEITCTNPVFINLNPQVQSTTTAGTCNAVVSYPLAVTGIPAPGLNYTFSGATTGSGSGTGTGRTFNKGTTHVMVTAVNPCSAVVYEFDVIVSDVTPPTAVAQNLTVNLNASGAATITAAQVNNGSSDNCGIASIAVDKTSFDCSNVGANTVTLTVTDVNGNVSTATAVVTVADNILPIATSQNITVQLGANGTASITAAQVNNGSSDNCGIASIAIDKTSFDCSNVGANTVTLTVTDVNGNVSTATAVVTVADNILPIATSQNITVQMGANGAATITAAQINNGSTDNCGIASIAIDKTSFDCSNVGTNTVTLTVTDVNGNSSTATATVTVVDNINPTITAPANIAQGTDAGVCGATVNLGTPVTADNCSIATVTNNAPTLFPVGTTVVTWTVTDVNGNSSTATQTVVIADTEKPRITAPALVSVVNTAGTCSATVDLGTPVTSDNCGVATVTNNAPALFPVGTTMVTWTVTDIHGNVTDTATQMVVVIDNDLPTISVNHISVNNDAGKCGATVSIPMPVTGDNCGVASVMGERSDNKLLTEDYPVGTTTITWTVRDVNGNMKTITQTIKVSDTEKPVIACAADQVFCANTGGNTQYTIPVLNQSDNCGIASTTYTVTGATNRTGTGTNASGSFAIGTSTVTFTVTDIHGNVSSCSFTVRINPLPVASITAATADALCNQFTLTANSTQSGPYTYQWLYGTTTKATTQQLSLGLNDADGVYSVYTTDANGCRSELAATYHYQKQNLVSSYTILGMKEVKLGQYDKVETGSVGVMSSKGEAEFDKYSSVTGVGSFVKAPRIDADKGVTISSKIYGVASVTLPTMQYNLSNTRYLQDKTINSNVTTTVAGNYDEVTLKKGSNVTLTGTVFGKIKLEEGASVRFTSSTLDVEEIQIEKGPKSGGYSYIRFAPNTSIRVSKKVTIGSDVIVNPEAYQVTFYMADNRRDEEKFHVKGDDTRITANIILPDGKLKVTGGNYGDDKCDHKPHSSNSCKHRGHGHHDCDHRAHGDRDCRDDVFMTGLFIAEEVESEGKNVIWNSYNCAAPSAPVTAIAASKGQATVVEEVTSSKLQAASKTEEELKVIVMPNPSTTYFTLKLESKYDAPVTLRVVDAAGRVVDSRAKISSNSTIQIGHNYHAGNYFAELVQGNRRKTIQLIKVR